MEQKLTDTRVCDVLNLAMDSQFPKFTDAEISTSCPGCKKQLTLDACSVDPAPEPTYKCPHCQGVVLTISQPGCGRGIRLGDFVLIAEADLRSRGIVLPAAGPTRVKLT